MKKIFIFMMIGVMLVLTGCGNSKEATQQGPEASMEEMKMDEITKLMAGTMLLETTSYPLDAEQESSLLLLWKGYRTVATSSTSSDQEIESLQDQIKGVFTNDQLTAIDGMGLTSETLTSKLAETGVQMGGPSAEGTEAAPGGDMMQMPMGGGEMPSGGNSNNQNRSGNSSNRTSGGGGMPGGMGGGGMPGGMGGGGMMSGSQSSITGETGNSELSQQATLMANSLSSITSRTTNTMLLNIVIQY